MLRITNIKEYCTIIVLFAFAISLFNLAGYIYAAIIILWALLYGGKAKVNLPIIVLILFSVFYFSFYNYHYDFEIENVVLLLFGPWTAYLIGKMYVENSLKEKCFLTIIFTLAGGMFLHGVLNLITYLKSSYYETYSYSRRSVDVWTNELVNVNATGMFYTFAAGICIGILFSNMSKKYKICAFIILVVCLFATIFFANRSLLAIVVILLFWRGAKWFKNSSTTREQKIKATIATSSGLLCFIIIIAYNVWNINEWINSLKISQRIISDNEGGRLDVWFYFLKSGKFLKHMTGGRELVENAQYSYVHNMWLDVYNVVGILPFICLLLFTIIICYRMIKYKNIMMKNGRQNEYIVFECLIVSILLNCAVEPIIEANPYYFIISMMFLGAINGEVSKLRREY